MPEQAVRAAKAIVLDTLGALLLGSSPSYAAARLTGELAKQAGGRPECTVVGRDFKTSPESAALANGTAAYAADVEGGRAVRQHAAAVLVPPPGVFQLRLLLQLTSWAIMRLLAGRSSVLRNKSESSSPEIKKT